MNVPNIIAIDGPAASGKSTLGLRLAKQLGYTYLDTGVMYRAVTLAALRRKVNIDDEKAVSDLAWKVQIDIRPPSQADTRTSDVLLDGEDITWEIRNPEVDACVSQVSAYPEVRRAMTEQQRRIGLRGKIILVGRDIGTVVLPEADLKIYLVASSEIRAYRRFQEIIHRGEPADLGEIMENIRHRDEIDSTRSVAPLKPAEDAVTINSDHLSIDEVVLEAEKHFS